MFSLPTLGNIAAPSAPSLEVETVVDVQVVPSHKKTFPLSSSVPERSRVEIPIVPAPRLSPLAKNVPAPTRVSAPRSPRMKRIKREDYIAALKSLPPLPRPENEPQGLSLALPQIPQTPVMLPNLTSAFEDIPREDEEEDLIYSDEEEY
nr:hypothetical protein Clen_482 [Cedratvirus lena]